jgi:hypothetical protein
MNNIAIPCPKCASPLRFARAPEPGKRIFCPRCGAPVSFGMQAAAHRPDPPPLDGEVARPAGSRALVVVVAGLFVLVGAAVGAIWWLSRDPGARDQVVDPKSGEQRTQGDNRGVDPRGPGPSPINPIVNLPKKSRPALPALPAEEQKRVDAAVAAAVAYLKKQQNAEGVWNGYHIDGVGPSDNFKLAYNALLALTLMECGEKPESPAVKWAVDFVRQDCRTNTLNYEIALSLLMLDKVGAAGDKPLLESLALRLIQSQQKDGGWTYQTYAPQSANQEQSLLAALETTRPRSLRDVGLDSSKGAEEPGAKGDVVAPEVFAQVQAKLEDNLKTVAALQPAGKLDQAHSFGVESDNSNTQFAVLALWVAGRYGIPTERALAVSAQRFRSLQRDDGHWPYQASRDIVNETFTPPTMTGSGLLALAVGHGLAVRIKPDDRNQGLVNDPAIKKGVAFLAARIGDAVGPNAERPKNRNRQAICLYYFWTLERVAVLYSAPKIGGKDWYQWGAELLVDNQSDDGSWSCGNYWGSNPWADTAFALLFLKRANLVQDLSDNIDFVIESSK